MRYNTTKLNGLISKLCCYYLSNHEEIKNMKQVIKTFVACHQISHITYTNHAEYSSIDFLMNEF